MLILDMVDGSIWFLSVSIPLMMMVIVKKLLMANVQPPIRNENRLHGKPRGGDIILSV
jgi:hypothetical protein